MYSLVILSSISVLLNVNLCVEAVFKCVVESFHRCIVIRTACFTHTLDYSIFFAKITKSYTANVRPGHYVESNLQDSSPALML